jgi:hypothetical protein
VCRVCSQSTISLSGSSEQQGSLQVLRTASCMCADAAVWQHMHSVRACAQPAVGILERESVGVHTFLCLGATTAHWISVVQLG